ncbi:unnamed protein product, partial [Ectocarpus sp. 12 AP-2014]
VGRQRKTFSSSKGTRLKRLSKDGGLPTATVTLLPWSSWCGTTPTAASDRRHSLTRLRLIDQGLTRRRPPRRLPRPRPPCLPRNLPWRSAAASEAWGERKTQKRSRSTSLRARRLPPTPRALALTALMLQLAV